MNKALSEEHNLVVKTRLTPKGCRLKCKGE